MSETVKYYNTCGILLISLKMIHKVNKTIKKMFALRYKIPSNVHIGGGYKKLKIINNRRNASVRKMGQCFLLSERLPDGWEGQRNEIHFFFFPLLFHFRLRFISFHSVLISISIEFKAAITARL